MNSRFDRQMGQFIRNQQAELAAGQAQLRQQQMQAYGPWLIQEWHRTGLDRVMSFEQFRYQMAITANGTNMAGGMEAMRLQNEGNQQAHQTQEQAGQVYINGMRANSEAQSAAVNRWDRGAIRGQWQYIDPVSGDIRTLPYYAPGQVQNRGGVRYYQDQYGHYYRY
jgi:hypothetical protein